MKFRATVLNIVTAEILINEEFEKPSVVNY